MLPPQTKNMVCKVLIIEDDPDDVFLFTRALERAKIILNREIAWQHVGSGLDAILLVAQQDNMGLLPHVLVLDINMPRFDGLQFLRSLRNSLELKDLPVFVLTTSSEAAIHEQAARAGADKVFVKPNDPESLLEIALEIVAKSAYGSIPHQGADLQS
jgi:CheY-like chemotaxis protein